MSAIALLEVLEVVALDSELPEETPTAADRPDEPLRAPDPSPELDSGDEPEAGPNDIPDNENDEADSRDESTLESKEEKEEVEDDEDAPDWLDPEVELANAPEDSASDGLGETPE